MSRVSASTFGDLKRNLSKDFSSFRKASLWLLSDAATQLIAQALRGEGYSRQLDLAVTEGGYGQIEQEILDPGSDLNAARPDFVIVYRPVEKLLTEFQTRTPSERATFAEEHLRGVGHLADGLAKLGSSRLLYLNFPEISDGVFGSYANKTQQSFLYQLRKINAGLMDLACAHSNLFIDDVALLAAELGRSIVTDNRIAISTDLFFGLEFLPPFAKRTLDIIDAALGKLRKCLILDLDNTVWGGVIGDDGIDNIQLGHLGLGGAYTQVQSWAKQLRERGIILAVSSKNDEQIAREPFEKHPDMVLRLEDVAVFKANWENKVDNIRSIQAILTIGFDSMVFVDDNPVERDQVRQAINEICVPELPDDAALYAPFLREQNLFETISVTEEDAARTQYYREESKRQTLQTTFQDEGEFLRSLQMVATVEPFTDFNVPRVAQLTQRSNQFNLRTVRYSEDEIARIAHSAEHVPFAFSLTDRFGAYGLVSVVILKKMGDSLFIDTWLMSCRVLKRGLESLVLNSLVAAARRLGLRRLVGEYVPTKKNALVKDHFSALGFEETEGTWLLDVGSYVDRPHFLCER